MSTSIYEQRIQEEKKRELERYLENPLGYYNIERNRFYRKREDAMAWLNMELQRIQEEWDRKQKWMEEWSEEYDIDHE